MYGAIRTIQMPKAETLLQHNREKEPCSWRLEIQQPHLLIFLQLITAKLEQDIICSCTKTQKPHASPMLQNYKHGAL